MDDVGKFISGFRQLVQESNMTTICYNSFGLIQLKFKDGSSIGMKALMNKVGFNWE